PIGGNSNLPNLGISVIDRATLIRKVSIVFHIAVTAIAINIQNLRDLIDLSKDILKLKVQYLSCNFIHVSTAFAKRSRRNFMTHR
ncbi:fatty acyl-CoA reductase wat-like isoform X1, partial [Vespula squamosa]